MTKSKFMYLITQNNSGFIKIIKFERSVFEYLIKTNVVLNQDYVIGYRDKLSDAEKSVRAMIKRKRDALELSESYLTPESSRARGSGRG